MNLERYCRKCGHEIVKEGDVCTMYEGKQLCKCDNSEPSWGWKGYMALGYRITESDEDEKALEGWITQIRNDAKKEVFDDIKKACIINSDTMFMTTIKNFEEVIEKIRQNHLGEKSEISNLNIYHKNKELAEEQMKNFLNNETKTKTSR